VFIKEIVGEERYSNLCESIKKIYPKQNLISANLETLAAQLRIQQTNIDSTTDRIPRMDTNQLIYDISIRFGPLILLTVAVTILGSLNRCYLRLSQDLESQVLAILLVREEGSEKFVTIYQALKVEMEKGDSGRRMFSLSELIEAVRGRQS